MSALTRTLRLGSVGDDVRAGKRACHICLDTGGAEKMLAKPIWYQRLYDAFFRTLVKQVQREAGLDQSGVLGPATERALRKAGAFDAKCEEWLAAYERSLHVLYYPHPAGATSSVCQHLHPTAGLDGNWAYDFCCPGGTLVVAPEAGEIVKISGHPPTRVIDANVGIYGWNLHLVTDSRYRWFSTHHDYLQVREGQRVQAGQVIARVGRWPNDPGRSHTHLGVTSPHGEADAKRRIAQVAFGKKARVGI
jgi:murein DD-endopeptidase MepM/ murein hydrolase activator NlpD